MNYNNKLFGVFKDNQGIYMYIFGIKITLIKVIKNPPAKFGNLNKISITNIQRCINIAMLHQETFKKYKNKFVGKTVVLVGAGPSLNYFEHIPDAIYIGVNRTFLNEKINFDYLFAIDRGGLEFDNKNYISDFLNYRKNSCVKFIGDQNLGEISQIPEGRIIGDNILRYKTTADLCDCRFTLDIESEPLGNFSTVSLQAIQFIMYTNPKKIYLVGMDCNIHIAGHFTDSLYDIKLKKDDIKDFDVRNINAWNMLKRFKTTYYPDTEIVSINPVGLRGVFKEEYTKSFLENYKWKMPEKIFNSKLEKYVRDIDAKRQIKKLSKKLKNKKVIIYGAGQLFQLIQKEFDLSELDIIGIADKKFTINDIEYLGYPVIQIPDIKKLNPDYVLVAIYCYLDVIENLETQELKHHKFKILPLVKKK